ncbi:hypothetical protein A3A39_00150 [Candidatus Kaiserbacteria bacterium RIFCSPLOWO2_01_FULL_54_13]|uniref:DUF155 domain-containing protein n=1 Tax=Candidatus Kaiserbacteria bacterium RIFCSPLOWO2_01_FULL_54_13 TaxID=1798512 RepID=A0A1F6F4B8_9BACT|nr:MAG: hypothetical protein A3A39_00150 [Candidatus Kaiserbacteria bacterium RIFCSPLOWO2_01_FULL_54_13]
MNEIKEFSLEAFYLAKEVLLDKAAEKLEKNLIGRRREFLTYLFGPHEFMFVFSFGAVVFVNIDKDTQTATKKALHKFLRAPVRKDSYHESYILRQGEKELNVGEAAAELPSINTGEIEIAARILAQSVALEYIEDLTDEILSNIESINSGLEKGKLPQSSRAVLRLFAQNNSIIQFVISKLALLDKPDIAWENERLEVLFSQLADMFELRSRFRNVEYKIGFARENSEFILTALQSRRESFLEIIIIVLIAIDILLYFFG